MPVKVNGRQIDDETIRSEAQRLLPALRREYDWMNETALKLQAEDMAKDRLVERRLLVEAARERMEAPDPKEVEKRLQLYLEKTGGKDDSSGKSELGPEELSRIEAEIADDLRLQTYLDRVVAEIEPVEEAAVAERYERDKRRFKTPERFKASHIVFHANEKQSSEAAAARAEEALRRLDAGEPFETLADEVSDCPGKGGSLGWFPRGQMVEEFERELDKLQPGQRSGVFKTPFGYHIARLEEREPEGFQPLDEVADQIRSSLESERREGRIEAVVKELKAKATIETVQPGAVG